MGWPEVGGLTGVGMWDGVGWHQYKTCNSGLPCFALYDREANLIQRKLNMKVGRLVIIQQNIHRNPACIPLIPSHPMSAMQKPQTLTKER